MGSKESPEKKIVPFQRDARYYYNKGTLYFQRQRFEKALMYFRKAVEMEPQNSLHYYNLGCLLSRMGQLREANRIFKYIVEELDPDFTECIFLKAINYGLLEDFEKTEQLLRQYLRVSPQGEMAQEARELLFSLTDWDEEEGGGPAPAEEGCLYRDLLQNSSRKELKALWEKDEDLRAALYRGLFQWDDGLKEKIISLLAAGREGEGALREFVKNPWIKERLRQIALLALKEMGSAGALQAFHNGKIQEVKGADLPPESSLWRAEWQRVLECALARMSQSREYDGGFFDDIRAMWLDYINTVYPRVPRIHKVETWAAGLEYCLARFHFLDITQREMAEFYGVSVSSVAAKYKEINEALSLEQKAYQNVVSYLSSLEEGGREGR
jgi:tetratricopeptide (TPR) repeat protein